MRSDAPAGTLATSSHGFAGDPARTFAAPTPATRSRPPTRTVDTVSTVIASPVATAVESGALRSGSASRMAADDDLYHEIGSTTSHTRTSAWQARFSGVGRHVRSLRLAYRGRSSATCAQTVSVWRWTTSGWAQSTRAASARPRRSPTARSRARSPTT